MKIAIDAMGAEKGINIVIEGTLKAINENSQIEAILGENKKKIEDKVEEFHLKKFPFIIKHASQVVSMNDFAISSLKKKRDSSINVALDILKRGEADALVSAGNTGAVMAASLLKIGRLRGVERPCLAVLLPTIVEDKRVVLLDAGANVSSRANHLFQFAIMGSVYVYRILKEKEPRVGLLNIGEEENKGNDLAIQTFKLLKQSSLNFVGNIEGRDITSGKVDVVICDGFIGNIILKFAEGFAKTTLSIVNREIKKSLLKTEKKDYSLLLLKNLNKSFDYAEYGGVPLLGVNKTCIIAHGASSSKAIKNAILTAYEFSKVEINKYIEKALTENKPY